MNELWYLQMTSMISGSAAIVLLFIDMWLVNRQRCKDKGLKKQMKIVLHENETQLLESRWEDVIWIYSGKGNG